MIKIRHTSDKDYFQFWGVYIQQNVLPFTDDHKVTVLWKRSTSPGKGRRPHINVEILCRSLNEKIHQNHWNFQISYSNQYAKYHIWPYSTTQTKSIGIFFWEGGGGYLLGYSIAGHFHFDVDFLRLGVWVGGAHDLCICYRIYITGGARYCHCHVRLYRAKK